MAGCDDELMVQQGTAALFRALDDHHSLKGKLAKLDSRATDDSRGTGHQRCFATV